VVHIRPVLRPACRSATPPTEHPSIHVSCSFSHHLLRSRQRHGPQIVKCFFRHSSVGQDNRVLLNVAFVFFFLGLRNSSIRFEGPNVPMGCSHLQIALVSGLLFLDFLFLFFPLNKIHLLCLTNIVRMI
jgi:hypothetical protein